MIIIQILQHIPEADIVKGKQESLYLVRHM